MSRESENADKFYRAVAERDARYDGRFYFGVTTTGIYCRPVCPAKPKKQNIRFYRSQTEAELAGFRPCLRCRPDLSPLSPLWRGTEAVVGRALSYIRNRPASVKDTAARVGMTDRHLRRLFQQHLGARPMDIALSNRLYLARQLLTESKMKVIDIAYASGFRSLRRFNDAFLKTYKVAPKQFRAEHATSGKHHEEPGIFLTIPYAQPFRFQEMLSVLRNHEVHGIDRVVGDVYERVLAGASAPTVFRVHDLPEQSALRIEILSEQPPDLQRIISGIKRLFDLSHNPETLTFTKRVPKNILQRLQHTRVVGSFDPFETAIATILGQLVSTEQARAKLKKLILFFGQTLPNSPVPELCHKFPLPEVLATAEIERVGITRVRANAVRELSKWVAEGRIDLDGFSDFDELRRELLTIKGVGPWTVEMLALRCFRDPDAFPKGDLIIARLLEKHNIDHQLFAPWRAYMTCALWNIFVEEKGTSK